MLTLSGTAAHLLSKRRGGRHHFDCLTSQLLNKNNSPVLRQGCQGYSCFQLSDTHLRKSKGAADILSWLWSQVGPAPTSCTGCNCCGHDLEETLGLAVSSLELQLRIRHLPSLPTSTVARRHYLLGNRKLTSNTCYCLMLFVYEEPVVKFPSHELT